MPRTFSLGQLMLVVTLICGICALVAAHRKELVDYLCCAVIFVPTGVVCLALASFARNRIAVWCASVLGAIIMSFLFGGPPMYVVGGMPTTVRGAVFRLYDSIMVTSPLGVLLLGGAVLLDEKFSHRGEDRTRE